MSNNVFNANFKNAERVAEMANHFLNKEVEVLFANGRVAKGILNYYNDDYVFLSNKVIINLRYVLSITLTQQKPAK